MQDVLKYIQKLAQYTCSQLTPSSVFFIENKFLNYSNMFSHIWKCVIIGKVQTYKKKPRKMPLSIIWYFHLAIILWFLFLAFRCTTKHSMHNKGFVYSFTVQYDIAKYFPYYKKLHTQNHSHWKSFHPVLSFIVPSAYDTYFIKRYLWAFFFKVTVFM